MHSGENELLVALQLDLRHAPAEHYHLRGCKKGRQFSGVSIPRFALRRSLLNGGISLSRARNSRPINACMRSNGSNSRPINACMRLNGSNSRPISANSRLRTRILL